MTSLTLSSQSYSRDAALDLALAEALKEKRRRQRLAENAVSHEQEIREKCKRLHGFVEAAWDVLEPGIRFSDNWHIQAICEHLEGVTQGHITRLQINVPPASMKSLLASVFWEAWEWGPAAMPWLRYLGTSYDMGYATRDSRRMRDLVTSSWYQALWPMGLTRTGEDDFENVHRGSRQAKVFANLTGGRGNRVILDDPHSVDTAESVNDRLKVTRRFRESLQSRLNDQKRDAIIVIMQRLHTRDVCGVIEELGLPYTKLILPMEFERKTVCITKFGGKIWRDPRTKEGELLDKGRFPKEVVEQLKLASGSHAYAGQYQQRPAAREGGMFKREWFNNILDAIPADGLKKICRRWDLAASLPEDASDPDWTAGVKMSTDGNGRFYVLDVIRFRDSADRVRKMIKGTATLDDPKTMTVIPQDPGQAGKDQSQSILRDLAGRRCKRVKETGDKGTRAEPFAAQLEAGNVYLLRAPWNEEFIEEHVAFDKGHDDQVDAAAGAFTELTLSRGLQISAETLARSGMREDEESRFYRPGQD